MTEVLSRKQLAFVREYAKDCNGAQAAIRAGYKAKSAKVQASVLLTKPNVRAAVAAGQAKAAAKAEVSVEYVIRNLRDLAEQAMADGDRAAANRSLELLGRHVGAFVDRLDIRADLVNLTDAELDRRIAERLRG